MDFLARNINTNEVTYLDILNNDFVKLTDSEISEYETQRQSNIKRAELQSQIDELEKNQARAMREIALNKSVDFAMGKLQALDEQISDLREQIKGL